MKANSILITGASSGIGAALAQKLATPGRFLALAGRNAARLRDVASTCTARGAQCRVGAFDLADRTALSTFIATCDADRPLEGVILSAGILDGRHKDQVVESGATARSVLEINLMAAIDLVHLVLPRFRTRGHGQIVLVASLAAIIPLADAPAYSASKSGLLSYGLALREAVAAEGVSVVVACPGYVSTSMAKGHRGARPGEIDAKRAADIIVDGAARNKAVIGFPRLPYLLVRLSRMGPDFLRRIGMRDQRFYVG